MALNEQQKQALANVLVDAEFPGLPNFERGKVRDSYDLGDGRRVMIASDRQSAFDHVLAAVPNKGRVLTRTAEYWFQVSAETCPNHVLSHPDPNVVIARRLDMLPVEMVVRDYLTGTTETSIWPMYESGERLIYGHRLPDRLRKNAKLPETLITPTTKAATGEHDRPLTADQIIAEGLLSEALWQQLSSLALALFAQGRTLAAKRGLIMVDTKYEFGLDEGGRVMLADEIHTPDSSRYWRAKSYHARLAGGEEPDSLDKEFLRLWIRQRCDPYREPIPEIPGDILLEFSAKYIALYETVTGQQFAPADPGEPIRERIEAALRRALPEFF